MARNSSFARREDRDRLAHRFNDFRRRVYRAPDGKLLGVFKGIAESFGYNVCLTRFVGVIALIVAANFFGANGLTLSLLVMGFFYLLLALLMQTPRHPGDTRTRVDLADSSISPPPPIPAASGRTYQNARVDLRQLDRQMDGLNRRIQRMETIVTGPEYEWNRKMRRY